MSLKHELISRVYTQCPIQQFEFIEACGIRGFERKVFEGADLYDRYPEYYPSDFENATNDISQLDADIWLGVFNAIKNDCDNGECNFVRRYFMGVK